MVFDPLPEDSDVKPMRNWDGSIMVPPEPVERVVDGPTRMERIKEGARENWFLIMCGVLAAIGLGMIAANNGSQSTPPEPVVAATTEPVVEVTTEPAVEVTTEPTVERTPSETEPTEEEVPPGQTVLFRGGPATGPWQQIGSVAEITHPDAPASARFAHDNAWADDANQSAELWDLIVAEVTADAIRLGVPADRPTFGSAPGSEPFNSFGGLRDIYRDDEAFTAMWNVTWLDGEVAVGTYYPYIVTFGDNEDIVRGPPFEIREDSVSDPVELGAEARRLLREWAATQGLGEIE